MELLHECCVLCSAMPQDLSKNLHHDYPQEDQNPAYIINVCVTIIYLQKPHATNISHV